MWCKLLEIDKHNISVLYKCQYCMGRSNSKNDISAVNDSAVT